MTRTYRWFPQMTTELSESGQMFDRTSTDCLRDASTMLSHWLLTLHSSSSTNGLFYSLEVTRRNWIRTHRIHRYGLNYYWFDTIECRLWKSSVASCGARFPAEQSVLSSVRDLLALLPVRRSAGSKLFGLDRCVDVDLSVFHLHNRLIPDIYIRRIHRSFCNNHDAIVRAFPEHNPSSAGFEMLEADHRDQSLDPPRSSVVRGAHPDVLSSVRDRDSSHSSGTERRRSVYNRQLNKSAA